MIWSQQIINYYAYLTYRCIYDFYLFLANGSKFVVTEWGRTCKGDYYLSGGAGASNLVSLRQCRRMVDEINKRFGKPGDGKSLFFGGTVALGNYPRGCFIKNNLGVYWSNYANFINPKTRSICKLGYSK